MFAVTVAERLLAKKSVPLSPVSVHTICISRSTSHITDPFSGGSSHDDDHDRSSQIIDCSLISRKCNNSVFIEHVPEELCDFLDIFIRSQNCGKVTAFVPDKRNNGILVTFKEAKGLLIF